MNIEEKRYKLTKTRIMNLHKLGLYEAEDVLTYYPFRYEELNLAPISTWVEKQRVDFEAVVVSPVRSWRFGRNKTGSKFDVIVQDELVHVTIFNRPWIRNLKLQDVITINGIYQGNHNVTAINYAAKRLDELCQVTPIYATKEKITQASIRGSIEKVFEASKDEIIDIVPIEMMRAYRLMHRKDALYQVHWPNSMQEVLASYRTLKYEEFLKFFTSIQLMKNEAFLDCYKQPKEYDQAKMDAFLNGLPFALTKDQKKVLDEVLTDLKSNKIMQRLVQGDVGCGKTIVAIASLYACYLSGYQSALLAPTEILARQHYQELRKHIQDPNVRIELLYSGLSNKDKASILEKLEQGEIDIIVGTHSLIQDQVTFKNLGFVIADEQQRFGVNQRHALKDKGNRVDFLLMSATPIPRTLASTLYGDMDISTIETMPSGRKGVVTKLIQENSFRSVLNEIQDLLKQGRQLYVICAAKEENEDFHARNVQDVAKNLTKYMAPYKVGMLHGAMNSDEKQEVMDAFDQNQIQILVSTTVVEVGMNVVNATGMIIYDAERFGLSQLHQLRGRVQRGSELGQCYLLTDSKDDKAIQRLEVLVKTTDGFVISMEDLRLRGPGDILGTRQSGVPDLVLGNLIEDTKMIEVARKDAEKIVNDKENPDYQALLDVVMNRLNR